MVIDAPNTFIHTNMPQNKVDEERVITKTTGVLVVILVELDNEMHSKHVVFEKVNKVIYVVVLK